MTSLPFPLYHQPPVSRSDRPCSRQAIYWNLDSRNDPHLPTSVERGQMIPVNRKYGIHIYHESR